MKKILLFAASIVALGTGLPAQPNPPEGGKWAVLEHGPPFDWPQPPALQPATGPVQRQQVLALLKEIDEGDWDDDYANSFIPFRFALLSSGKVYLLALAGSRFENTFLEAVYCQQARCFWDSVPVSADLNNGIVDVDGDGFMEVIGRACFYDCTAFQRVPLFVYSIYKFVDGKGFVDFSAQAASYYREHLLPEIQAAQNEIESRVAAMRECPVDRRN
jgi:hypothetical protein